jgi:hypothetical protein
MFGLPFITIVSVGGFLVLVLILLALWGFRFREAA